MSDVYRQRNKKLHGRLKRLRIMIRKRSAVRLIGSGKEGISIFDNPVEVLHCVQLVVVHKNERVL